MMAANEWSRFWRSNVIDYLIEASMSISSMTHPEGEPMFPQSCHLPYPREWRVCQWACEEASRRARTALARIEFYSPQHMFR